jgi:hypothetical protein
MSHQENPLLSPVKFGEDVMNGKKRLLVVKV